MKNKVLASLLAVCMFVGMAVPAFAEYSSQSGLDEDITKIEFVKDSYTAKNGGDAVDLSKEIRAYASTKQLVQEPNIVWSIENDDKYAFSISDAGAVTASEDAGTATVIATGKDGKVVGKTKVVAAKNVILNATGFQFDGTTKVLKYGMETMAYGQNAAKDKYNNQEIDIVATPKDAIFTAAQLTAIDSAVNLAVTAGAFDITDGTLIVSPDVVKKANKVTLVYKTGDVSAVALPSYLVTVTTAATSDGVVTVGGVDVTLSVATDNTIAKQAEKIAKTINNNSAVWTATYVANAAAFTLTPKQGHYYDDQPTAATKTVGTAFVASVAPTAMKIGTEMAGLSATKIDAKRSELSVEFPNANEKITSTPTIKKSVTISGVQALAVNAINAAGTVTVEVGEKVSTKNMFKQTPSKGNITFDVTYNVDYVDGNAQVLDYATKTDNADDLSEIIGVAVGTNRLVGTITNLNGKQSSASIIVKVVEKGTKPGTPDATKVSISPITGKATVGAPFNIVVKGAEGKDVTYTSLIPSIATVDATGKVTPVAAGTVKIAVKVGETTLYSTITVAAAPITKPGEGGTTTPVPPTGVVLLGQLF